MSSVCYRIIIIIISVCNINFLLQPNVHHSITTPHLFSLNSCLCVIKCHDYFLRPKIVTVVSIT